ncbi:MAG: tripartite tricarboxylate transporter substrate binding protein [Alphaproteobacteria bacterium]|nr:tripartite tricarboxylate transporter substrate binding protein [Alphaproteobacteria bacterium]
MKRRQVLLAGGAVATGALSRPSLLRAQTWPAREVSIIVAVGPGSSADSVARGVARVVAREIGGTVQVRNVLGGAGLTGFTQLAQSAPDGYTFGLVNVGGLLVFPHVQRVSYTWDSFAFLGGVAENYYGIAIAAGSPIRTIADLVAAARSRRVTFAASAIMNGIAMIQLGNATGTRFHFVPTATQPEAIAQAVGGHVDLVVQTPADIVPMVEGGRLRLLAACNGSRWPNYPDVPTLRDLGYDAATIVPLGFACPAAVPAEIRARLQAAIALAAQDADLQATMRRLTIMPRPLSGPQFAEAIRSQAQTVEGILVAAGMKRT